MDKVEKLLRERIRKKISTFRSRRNQTEEPLREAIRKILREGDVSDVHPHRSTAINILEDVLKKAIPTLRTDYKRLTTEKSQRDSFRAHILKAIKDALAPSLVNWQYLSGQEGDGLMSEPPSDNIKDSADGEEENFEMDALEEADIEVDISDDGDGETQKKVPVEADDEPSPEEDFGSGLEEMDETGRNMGYTSFRKISQYILDAYDTLANGKDKEVFVDYLLTNIKLYFDKFEDELQKTVVEPESSSYQKAAQ